MSETTLIHDENDPKVIAAASGMRPVRGLVRHQERFYCFAPSTTTYKVTKTGAGTHVYFYGTDENDQSCAVRVSGFRPYMYVSLASVPDDAAGHAIVENLVEQLQATLLTISAYDKDGWSPERTAFSESIAGYVRVFDGGRFSDRSRDPQQKVAVHLREARNHCLPIVGWEITHGRPVKGSGIESGYRGMHTTRFLKIYFYSPALVSVCRAILHGKYAKFGVDRQARKLAKRVVHDDAFGAAQDAGKGVRKTHLERKIEAARQSQTKLWVQDGDDVGDGGVTDDPEIAAVQGPKQAKSWHAVLDSAEARMDPFDDDDDDDSDNGEDPMIEDSESGELEFSVAPGEVDVTKEQMQAVVDQRFLYRARQRLMAASNNQVLGTWNVYEADIDFVLRVMLDCGFAPEEFVEIDMLQTFATQADGSAAAEPIGVRELGRGAYRETRATVELQCDYRHLCRSPDERLQNTSAKHTRIALDCEMKTAADGGFPKPESESMLQCVFIIRDDHAVQMGRAQAPPPKGKFYFRSVSFVLGTVDCRAAPRDFCTDRHILSFASEATMFRAMANFITRLDPHIVSGYNSNGFDLPYMKRRAEVLDVGPAWARAWSRSTSKFKQLTIRERTFGSTAAGKIAFCDVRAEGVLFIDVLHQLRKDPMVKLRSYSLNAVAFKYLKANKEDVAYSLINVYNEEPVGREKLRSYCEKDALLPLEIMQVQQIDIGLIEMARINNCPIDVIINRGQQIRCKCALYKAGAAEHPPQRFYTRTQAERDLEQDATYEGAEVIEPKPGLYDSPVATLDWSSLYPSIMVTHNLDPSTLVQPDYSLIDDPYIMRCANPALELTMEERLRRADEATYTVCDMVTQEPYSEAAVPQANGAPALRFLRHTVCVGISTKVQKGYLAHRSRTKKAMEEADDSDTQALLNQRQLAIKMLANSLYGMYGATCSFLFTPAVAAAVTQRGRCLLYLMRWLAMSNFAEFGTEVIYGDTDSIFVLMRLVKTIEEAAELGLRMAAFITQYMKQNYTTEAPEFNILELAFEKVFRRLLLLAKKRYAGLKYEYSFKTKKLTAKADGGRSGESAEGVPVMSGLESKRRDVTLLIAENIEDVIALLLDFRYSSKENLVRARGFVWNTMVRPLIDLSVNMHSLAITKQLRMLPEQYKAANAGSAVPIHVHLAEKLIVRAGGKDSANAPRSGDRLSYVVVRGTGQVSTRAEDPVYALDNSVPIDSHYYLDRHVKPTLLRLFAPIWNNMPRQRTLDGAVAGETVFGKTKSAQQRHFENAASEFLFGHITEYVDPVPQSERAAYATIMPMAKEKAQQRRPFPRYRVRVQAPVENKHTAPQVGTHAARCIKCRRTVVGLAVGAACEKCQARHAETIAVDACKELAHMMIDIEDLHTERRELVDTCQKCMGCADAPQVITCKNADCKTFWQRKMNLGSIEEAERRAGTQFNAAIGTNKLKRRRLVLEPGDMQIDGE